MDAQTEALLREVASRAASEAVNEAFLRVGLDHSNPIEVQKDLAALRVVREMLGDTSYQADMLHLRRWRCAMDQAKRRGVITAVGFLITGAIALIWMGMQSTINSG